MLRKLLFFVGVFCLTHVLNAQLAEPVKWKYSYSFEDANTVVLQFVASIDNKWHLYGCYFGEGGPYPTQVNIEKSESFIPKGKVVEVTPPIKKRDPIFEIDITYHTKKAVLEQRISISDKKPFEVNGEVLFMACNDETCTPQARKKFNFKIVPSSYKPAETTKVDNPKLIEEVKNVSDSVVKTIESTAVVAIPAVKDEASESKDNEGSLLGFFLLALIAGLLGTVTPCVFPMIPMTVSFFMRGSENRKKAIGKGILFGFSIAAIYTLIGVVVSLSSVGSGFANAISTNWIANSLFFLLFVIFAASFLGLFELVLPSGLVNKVDAQADRGGFIGIVFMALATVLVSFSCTGPIVGSLLVEAAGGQVLKPILGMFGFGLAFALPFTLFAIFPAALNALPKSGGWLNSVKVFLGFIVVAFSLKFLVNIDQAYHTNILSRDMFLAIWIVLAILLGLYILGKIRFAHDSVVEHVSFQRIVLAGASFVFALYLFTGFFNRPLDLLSSLLPPKVTYENNITTTAQQLNRLCNTPKYSDFLHLPYGLQGYFDLEEGLKCAKQQNKPVLLDFKGHACSNCKVMEASVFSDKRVQQILNDSYVIIALYIDDKKALADSEQYVSKISGNKITTIGEKNYEYQVNAYKTNTQPYFVVLDVNGNPLTKPVGFIKEPDTFIKFLEEGKSKFAVK